jgi:chemotaxis protein MotB
MAELPPVEDVEGASRLPPEVEKVKSDLVALAEGDPALQGLELLQRRNELVLRLSDNVFFESGNDALKEPAAAIIHAIAPRLVQRNVDIRVEGHTDNRPISTVRFRSNWDLSTARATAVISKLAAEGLEKPRLSAAGYGEFRPVADNDTEEGRKQNRRVDLVISVAVGETHEQPVKK